MKLKNTLQVDANDMGFAVKRMKNSVAIWLFGLTLGPSLVGLN
jgi:hypothetical protein